MIDDREKTERLAAHLTERRRERIETVLAGRIANLCLVLEDLQDPFNISACLRTAEAFGIQHVHIIEHRRSAEVSPGVSQRAHKWLSISQDSTPAAAARFLREGQFTLLVSTPEPGEPSIGEIDLTGPIALAFGNETEGISSELEKLASRRFHIPMTGFVESLNVTVSVAVSLREILLSSRFEREPLSPEDRDLLRLQWYRQSVNPKILAQLDREGHH